MTVQWTYRLEIVNDARVHPTGEKRFGAAWVLVREDRVDASTAHVESIVASPDVFESDREAKRDALEKLSILACQVDQPLARVIKALLDG